MLATKARSRAYEAVRALRSADALLRDEGNARAEFCPEPIARQQKEASWTAADKVSRIFVTTNPYSARATSRNPRHLHPLQLFSREG